MPAPCGGQSPHAAFFLPHWCAAHNHDPALAADDLVDPHQACLTLTPPTGASSTVFPNLHGQSARVLAIGVSGATIDSPNAAIWVRVTLDTASGGWIRW